MSGHRRLVFASISIVLLFAACDVDTEWTHNSNQGDNQYFEEPLSEKAQKYSRALETSNAFVEFFARGQLEEAMGLFDADLSQEQFHLLHEQFLKQFGPLIEYKPMQWGFATRTEKPNILAVVKIVVHENSETFYVLTFEDDDVYERILGFRVIAKNEGERIEQAASHVLNSSD